MSTDTNADAETDPNSERAREELIELASEFYDQFAAGDVPRMRVPTRIRGTSPSANWS